MLIGIYVLLITLASGITLNELLDHSQSFNKYFRPLPGKIMLFHHLQYNV